jgi:AhpD family alkylhydroperoxidase
VDFPQIVHMSHALDLAPLVHLDEQLRGLVGLAVTQDNACRFCCAGVRVLLRVMGMPDTRI